MLDTALHAATPTENAALFMLQLTPDMPRLVRWAETQRLLHPHGNDDLGYALHAVLKAAFDALAPAPFALIQRPRRPATLLAYSAHNAEALRDQAATFADPKVATAIGLTELADKRMPARFAVNTRLGFTVRVRPLVRTDRDGARDRSRERDAFLAAIEGTEQGAGPSRGDVYQDWLRQRMTSGGAHPERLAMESYSRSTTLRRNAAGGLRSVEYPDATFSGVLNVTDPAAFATLLARGVGRHRAFGCGMLLLKPPPC
jgi:CRISPR system Cascade subunit CasE